MAELERSGDDAPRLRYAAGLPGIGERPLEQHEIAWMRRRLQSLRRGLAASALALVGSAATMLTLLPADAPQVERVGGAAFAWLGLVGLVGVLGCLLLARGAWRVLAALGSLYLLGMAAVGALEPRLTPRPQGIDAAVVVGMILLGTTFVAVGLMHRIALWRRRAAIEADLERGVVDRYAGSPGPRPAAALRRLGAIDPGELEPVRLEVLPSTGLVVRVNGRRHERWSTCHVATIAPARPHALRVGLPPELIPAPADPRLRIERRSLSPDERLELVEHAHRLRRKGPVAAITLTVVAITAWQLSASGSLRDAFDVVTLAWYALLGLAWIGYVRQLRAAHKLSCDEKLRWVVTVHDAADVGGATPPKLEVLPVSQLAWTEHARPAGWRVDEL